MYAKDKKCGICQQNIIANIAAVMFVNSLEAANQPPTGGSAPGIAPTSVLIEDIFLNGV